MPSSLFLSSMLLTFPLSVTKELRIQLKALMIKAPNTADQNPCTWKPGITPETIFRMKALMRKLKSPKVMMLMGRVRMNRMGLKNTFRTPKTAAAKKGAEEPLDLDSTDEV